MENSVKSDKLAIIGSKGGSESRAAVEAPDSLQSRDYARILDLVSEGPIAGLVNELRSVRYDDVPLQNADGTYNFQGFVVETRTGTQDQPYIPGFPSTENEISVGVEIQAATPIVRTISDAVVDAVRVRVTLPQLSVQDQSSGDTNGSSVEIAIDIKASNGDWYTAVSDAITGKTMSAYARQYRIELAGQAPWQVRVRRLTPDSTAASLQNKTIWTSFTEVVDAKLRYPNSALIATSIDAKLFDSIPTRSFDLKGLIIQVPSNYDPATRTYSGIWNGTFKPAWTDNPAWIYYALATNKRWGLGRFVEASSVNKWALYEIARYCDELVPNGFGSVEPRYTCNMYLQTRTDAYKVLQDMTALFWGMSYWAGSQLNVNQDSPKDPEAIFTPANVIDGKFEYTGASLAQRHTVCLVTWNNPALDYKQDVEYVADDDGIAQWGVRQVEINAIGCTSRGQAHRAGRRLLYTEAHQGEVISFKVGMDSAFLRPGSIVQVADPRRTGKRSGGRLLTATASQITLDKYTALGGIETLSVMLPDGSMEKRTVASVIGNIVSVTADFSAVPLNNAVWVMAGDEAQEKLWQVTGIKDEGDLQFSITAVAYDLEKYAYVDRDLNLTVAKPAIQMVPAKPGPLTITEHITNTNGYDVVVVNVDWIDVDNALEYHVNYRSNDGNWKREIVSVSFLEIRDLAPGKLDIQVTAAGRLGMSGIRSQTYTVGGEGNTPAQVTNLVLEEAFVGPELKVKWDAVYRAASYDVVVCKEDGTTLRSVNVGNVTRFGYSAASLIADGGPYRTLVVKVRAITAQGLFGEWATLTASNSAPAVLTGIRAFAGFGPIMVSWDVPPETDVSGYLVHLSDVSGFLPSPATLIVDQTGTSTALLNDTSNNPLQVGKTYYLRVAAYDLFGRSQLNFSGEIPVTITTIPQTYIDLQNLGPVNFDVATAEAIANMTALEGVDLEALAQIDTAKLDAMNAELDAAQAALQKQALDQLYALTAQGEEGFERRKATAAIITEKKTRIQEFEAVATDISGLIARIGDAEASLVTTNQSIATLDAASSQQVTSLTSTVGANKASADSAIATLTTMDSSLSQRIDSLTSTVNGNKATADSSLSALATADTALGQRIDTLTATVSGNKATADSILSAFATADTALGQRIDSLTATVTGNKTSADAAMTTESQARASGDSANATSITTLKARLDTGDIATAISAQATRITTAETSLTSKASATDLTNLTTTVNGNTSSISNLTQSINGVNAQWSVSMVQDVNGVKKVAGVRLLGDGTTSAFDVLADAFRVSMPDKTGSKQVFTVGMINGVGAVGISGDMFVDGAVTARTLSAGAIGVGSAVIADAAVGTLKIAGNAVTLPVGADLANDLRVDIPHSYIDPSLRQVVSSAYIDTGGQPLYVTATYVVVTDPNEFVYVELLLDGVMKKTELLSYAGRHKGNISAYIASPGTGNKLIQVRMYTWYGGTASSSVYATTALASYSPTYGFNNGCTLFAIGMKR